jgi:hypothetical protein
MRSLLLATTAAVLLVGQATASTFDIVNVGTSFADNAGIIDIAGTDPWTTPIILTTDTGQTFFTYCDDFNHNITIEGGQNLTFIEAPVTTNGSGVALTESQSNIMGQLAGIGLRALAAGNFDLSIAAQAAIWATEPGNGPATSTNATVESDITMLLDTVHNNGTGFAMGLISPDGVQGQILPSAAVPEPATWAMMLLGFIGLGYAARTRRVAL